MNKTLFIETDCLAVSGPRNANIETAISFRPGVFKNLSRLANELDYSLVLVTSDNKDEALKNGIIRFFKNEEIVFAKICNESDAAEELRQKAMDQETTFHLSYPNEESDEMMITGTGLTLASRSWGDIYKILQSSHRKVTVQRTTSETDVKCVINLDGMGQNNICTGLGFFDHMLQQIARHGHMDLDIQVKGDLHIDEHHTIEDVGLAMGAAFIEALGNKKGIERYGFLLPMDDCLAQVAIDFGGRPWLVWEADFKREKVGDMPTEMFYHFFKSFSDTAKCNLNIKAEGSNEHHKIESIFKAFSRAIKMAITKNNSNSIPSTKGTL